MSTCERCGKQHSGEYGSGRFCSKGCASAYSTAAKREEINRVVSAKLRGHRPSGCEGFKPGFDPNRHQVTKEESARMHEILRQQRQAFYSSAAWEQLPKTEKYRRGMAEQDGRCLSCGLNEWMGKSLMLEIDHVNGRHNDDSRGNLRYLCLNCHSQTPTFRNRRRD